MKMKFTAVGDMLIQRRIPEGYKGYDEVRKQIKKGDARFFNLETTLNNGEFFANQFYGGSHLRANPDVLDDARNFGFNLLTFSNNHTTDFSHDGLMQTKKYVDAAGFPNSGAGANLDEAAAPAYLDTVNGRVALISAVSTLNNVAGMAGQQSRRYKGRPGLNGLRFDEHLEITREQLEVISQISAQSKINAEKEILINEGYFPKLPDNAVVLKDMKFVLGEETKYVTLPNEIDMKRIEKAIYDAQMQADYILISIHSHELSGDKKENPSQFLQEFAHRCIDAGAHAVIGHGPHLLRPIEIYKNRPIFYSLGDFVIHNECIPYAPEEMYNNQNLTSDATMRELFCDRSANYTRGLMRDHRMLESVIPYFEMENGELTYLELMPIELNFEKEKVWQRGNPRFSSKHGIIERLAEMSKEYATKINLKSNGFGIVEL